MTLPAARVFVVEDESFVALLIEEYLTDLGYDVVSIASRLEEALVKAHTLLFDVAVLDVNLAGKTSYPVAELLRSRGIPFVFATGYGASGLPDTLAGTPVLAKPFRQNQLGDLLTQVRGG